jgi:major intrinsic protein
VSCAVVIERRWVLPYWVAQFAGAIGAALFLQVVFGQVSAGGNYPIDKPGGDWRAFVMEIVLTTILVSVILHTATGGRSIGHNAAIAVGSTVALLGLFASPISGSSMNPARTLGPDIIRANFTGWWLVGIRLRRHHRRRDSRGNHRLGPRSARERADRGSRRRLPATMTGHGSPGKGMPVAYAQCRVASYRKHNGDR